jgi:hypothetical protein
MIHLRVLGNPLGIFGVVRKSVPAAHYTAFRELAASEVASILQRGYASDVARCVCLFEAARSDRSSIIANEPCSLRLYIDVDNPAVGVIRRFQ